MKKKTTRTNAKKTTRRTVKRTAPTTQPVLFQRIVIISAACIALFAALLVTTHKQTVIQSVAGTSIARGLFMQTTVTMPTTPGAVSYNIYYKQTNETKFTNAVRKVSPSIRTYTISYLKKGTAYQYRVSALGTDGKEYGWSEIKTLTNLQPM